MEITVPTSTAFGSNRFPFLSAKKLYTYSKKFLIPQK
jgi:hypothetical protein